MMCVHHHFCCQTDQDMTDPTQSLLSPIPAIRFKIRLVDISSQELLNWILLANENINIFVIKCHYSFLLMFQIVNKPVLVLN